MNAKKTSYRQQRLELVSRFDSSGLSADQFCRKNNLPLHQFYYWLKIAKEKMAAPIERVKNNFVAVKVVKQSKGSISTPAVELTCPNGIKLAFYPPVNYSELRALIG